MFICRENCVEDALKPSQKDFPWCPGALVTRVGPQKSFVVFLRRCASLQTKWGPWSGHFCTFENVPRPTDFAMVMLWGDVSKTDASISVGNTRTWEKRGTPGCQKRMLAFERKHALLYYYVLVLTIGESQPCVGGDAHRILTSYFTANLTLACFYVQIRQFRIHLLAAAEEIEPGTWAEFWRGQSLGGAFFRLRCSGGDLVILEEVLLQRPNHTLQADCGAQGEEQVHRCDMSAGQAFNVVARVCRDVRVAGDVDDEGHQEHGGDDDGDSGSHCLFGEG
eukprot:392870-Rhodomonas_salina.2